MYLTQYEQKKVASLIMQKVSEGKLAADPGILTAVMLNLFFMQDSVRTPRLAFGKAVKVRPKDKGRAPIQGVQMNIFGLFIWHYHLSRGGTLKNLAGAIKGYVICGQTKLGDIPVPKMHRMNTKVREWAKLGESVEENLYRIQHDVKRLADPKQYAEAILNEVIKYLNSL